MRHSVPRLLNLHRWELGELKDQLAVLSRLRMDMEHQQRVLSDADDRDNEAMHRRAQLEQSLAQLDEQIKSVQEQINGRVRAVRLLEAAPRGRRGLSSDTAEAV